MKKVTAVLPARNCRSRLHRCLLALHAGSCVPEIIVVDDGSEDGTAGMIRTRWPSVTLLTLSAHTGYAHASNAGLRLVRTEYALLLRPDLQVGRSGVEHLLSTLRTREDAFCAVPEFSFSKIKTVAAEASLEHSPQEKRSPRTAGDETAMLSFESRQRGKRRPASEEKQPAETLAVPDGCAMYRMSALEEIGWFDERLYDGLEALDLSLRAALYGYRTIRVPAARVRQIPPARILNYPDHTGQTEAADDTAGRTQETKGFVPQAAGYRQDIFHRQLAAGNRRYLFYKYLPGLSGIPFFPLFTAAEAAAALSFARSGQGGAYRMAVTRGSALCSLERERRRALADGTAVWAEKLPDAAFLGMDEAAERIYPLFLAEKEPFSANLLPEYLRIGRLLLKEIASGRLFGATV